MDTEFQKYQQLENELYLKKLQIRSLQTITQAINENISSEELFQMYKSFLSWEMGVKKMALYIKNNDSWECVSKMNDKDKLIVDNIDLLFEKYKRLHTISANDPKELQYFNLLIPILHKDIPLAYALLEDIKDKDKIQFIILITNIIAVAIENKRLFKRQLEQERLNRDIQLAKEVQQMLIPDYLPQNERFEIGSIYKPHYNVGGDYLDFFQFDKDKFAFCIADISGKGMAAAMLMANFQAIIQSLIYQYRDLETFIFALNEIVYKRIIKSDKYITFFIAEVDLKSNKLKYINAGHYPPILCMNNEVKRLETGCTVIGAFEKMPNIEEEVIELKDDAMILTFTDGLTELKDINGDFLEDSQIENFVCKNNHLGIGEFNKKLLNEIDSFNASKNFDDDIAILSCKIKI
ncbi:MAG TPA: serine/threonine protein phosphatase [Bacteroidetes bacterium]|nr:serine/threonine protein phosphatase [Bacteroidota bacterium]